MPYPIHEVLPALRDTLQSAHTVLLQAPPGAGKSTIVPLELLNEPWLKGRKIVMLEPRRLATRAVAMRMASLIDEEVGRRVGYRIRFEHKVSGETRIEVVTEAILTRMIQEDNALEDIGLVIFDEFHERSLQADLALALSRQVHQLLRNDLRILIMSATLDGSHIAARLGNAPLLTGTGKQHPVTIRYMGDEDARITIQTVRAVQRALREYEGDILVFLPGAGEIKQAKEMIDEAGVGAAVHALYGDLPFNRQQEALQPDPDGRRKIVLATSIAETSLTIEGIRIVVDSGYSRVPRFDPRSGLTRLETVRVSKDSADQRAGRAGRLAAGVCFRLWSEVVHHNLQEQRMPEILEADLTPLVLELCAWGAKNPNELEWITPPPSGAVAQAFDLLRQLEAIDEAGKISDRGKWMVQLPTHPRIAQMLIESAHDQDHLALATDLAALLEERDPLQKASGVDLSLRLSSLRHWRSGEHTMADTNTLRRIEKLASSWRRQFRISEHNEVVDGYDIGKLLMQAYPERIAKQVSKNSERYKLANGRQVRLPDHDHLVREPWLTVAHLDSGIKEGKVFLAAALAESDLQDLAHESRVVRWNGESRRVEAVVERRVGNLVLSSRVEAKAPADKRITVLCEVIRQEGLKMLGWSEAQQQWQARVMSLKHWHGKEDWPDVSDEQLLGSVEDWLAPYLTDTVTESDLRLLDLATVLNGMLGWERKEMLDRRCPEKIEVPSGSMIRVKYFSDGAAPVMEVRLQEVFGWLETPAVNDGRTRIVLYLLSPGFKPVQVTQDLGSFWQSTYAEVRKELRRRYPRHAWPEDPLKAKAIRGVPKRSSGR